MKAIYSIEFFFHADPDTPEADLGRALSNRLHQLLGTDEGLHSIAAEFGVTASGRTWERREIQDREHPRSAR